MMKYLKNQNTVVDGPIKYDMFRVFMPPSTAKGTSHEWHGGKLFEYLM